MKCISRRACDAPGAVSWPSRGKEILHSPFTNGGKSAIIHPQSRYAPVAQWIEHRIPVPRVGGSSPFWRTKNGASPWGCTVFAFQIEGTRKSKCNSPVDCCLPTARRRQHLSVTSPFWRTKRALKKHAGGMFLARGRVPLRFQTHPVQGCGWNRSHFGERYPSGCLAFWYIRRDSKRALKNMPVACF